MESGEEQAQKNYGELRPSIPKIDSWIRDEDSHEHKLLEMLFLRCQFTLRQVLVFALTLDVSQWRELANEGLDWPAFQVPDVKIDGKIGKLFHDRNLYLVNPGHHQFVEVFDVGEDIRLLVVERNDAANVVNVLDELHEALESLLQAG